MRSKHENYTIGKEERIPSMRIAVTGGCNLKCQYCPINGDNYVLKSRSHLTAQDFSRVAEIAYNRGIYYFSITGGEPLAVPDVTFDVAETIGRFPNLGYLRLNTNGTFLEKYADMIKETGFTKAKVSLDSLRTGKYTNPSEKPPYDVADVLRGLKAMQEMEIPVRINMVVGKYNFGEIPEMIEFCTENEFELKLFDITHYRAALSVNPTFWRDNYVSLLPISKDLERQFGDDKVVWGVGGFGNPMTVFRADTNSPIRLRISEINAKYRPECIKCKDYMCQDGFCNLTLTTDGDIKLCRPEGLDFDLNLSDGNGTLVSDEQVRNKMKKAIELFQGTHVKDRNLEEMVSSWNYGNGISLTVLP